ncbi:MAG: hypothetical protein K9M98_05385 [Cephaloticoccus sp.]|nr:hypothetical protein [Cephaloticoccus sp.]MCF7759916.1 hypothetical protein [Cephaloticoccus sp.]
MAAIDEGIVREYFEQNGFLVRQMRKYQVQARRKTSEEEIDLLVYNPAWRKGTKKPDFFLFSSELQFINRAVVAVKPWHTDVFSPGMLKSSPEIFRFLEENVLKEAKRFFPAEAKEDTGADLSKILVLPGLPTAEPFRSQSVEVLKEHGVDGIISFRSMLLDLIEKVEVNRSYRKSDTLQVIRILKNYDLLKDAQLDMFPDRPTGTKRTRN